MTIISTLRTRMDELVTSEEATALLRWAAIFWGLVLLSALSVGLLYVDVVWLKNQVTEYSTVEFTQEVLVALCAALFTLLAIRRPEARGFSILVAGFMGCMFIRELDAFLDMVHDGLWQYLAYSLTLLCIYLSLRQNGRQTMATAARFAASHWGMLMAFSLALLLCYSRFIGKGSLWEEVLDSGYARVVKNATEEGTELLAYLFLLMASIGLVRQELAQPAMRGRLTPKPSMPLGPRPQHRTSDEASPTPADHHS